uniref:DNA 3'-5' helicase n=2 Tax=Clastoptera arizonana TaxID=38151 RepID=A0A1B6C918_9HEMI
MEELNLKKYVDNKAKVKKWESEFKANHGTVPTKKDIKSAPFSIKEAYKTYYTLKTLVLENSLLDSSINENIQDGFSSMVLNSNNIKQNPSSVSVNKVNFNCDYTGNLSNYNIKQTRNESSCVDQEIYHVNKTTVWGPHVSKMHKEKQKKSVSLIPSDSLSYSEKLFPGAKFKKRNPRKLNSVIKTSTENNKYSSKDIKLCHSENSQSSYGLNVVIDQNSVDYKKEKFINDTINDKIKIVNSTPPAFSQPVSVLQKTLNNEVSTTRKLNRGWIERNTKCNQLETNQDITLVGTETDFKDSNCNERYNNDLNKSVSLHFSDNDEDFIYDSDSDLKNESNFLQISHKRSFEHLENSVDNRLTKRLKIDDVKSAGFDFTMSGPDRVNDVCNTPIFESTSFQRDETYLPSYHNSHLINCTETNANIIMNVTAKDTFISTENLKSEENVNLEKSLIDKCSNLLQQSLTEVKIKKNSSKLKNSSQERLAQKVTSGKANDNYVKVNIQKKVFVRGKKTLTYSKFKKNQWKSRQKSLYGNGYINNSGIVKCFKCGDIGHFARTCIQGKAELLKREDDDNDEEGSLFPTLEEAEKMAEDCAKRLTIKKQFLCDEIINEEKHNVDETKIDLQHPEVKREQSYMTTIEPVFQLNKDSSLIDTPLVVFETLMMFGHDTFRPNQEQIIMRILSGISTLVTLATGTGKSLCYQLPAYLYHKFRKTITLVVSPLVSLMEDQVAKKSSCLKIACLHAGQTQKKKEIVLKQLKNNELSVLLVSPEAVVYGVKIGVKTFFQYLPPIAFACIDEAHCVSQWSHNFRPSYLTILKVLREKLNIRTILGLTATATVGTISSISTLIGVPDGIKGIFKDLPIPDNLILSISREKNKDVALLTLLRGSRFKLCESIIIYCTRREECERLATLLRTQLKDLTDDNIIKAGVICAEAYHAGMQPTKRQSIQNRFMSGKLPIIVATVAFGMGINKPDIRGIIHYNMPSTFESYVQEIGRAGRDGQPAHCHLFMDSKNCDLNELRRHIYSNSTERHTIRKLLQKVFVNCQCKSTCPGHEVMFSIDETVTLLDLKQEIITTLLCYLELYKENWVKILTPSYLMCSIQSYRGVKYLKEAAKKCAPLAMAFAMEFKQSDNIEKINKLDFSVYDIARIINWDCGIVKRHLKDLEWITVNNQIKRSPINVDFANLGFRLHAPGNIDCNLQDTALDSLYNRVKLQETIALKSLEIVYQTFDKVSFNSVEECIDEVDLKHSEILKSKVREYFSGEAYMNDLPLPEETLVNEDQIVTDIRDLIRSYKDCNFTGRAVARIFHGIQSPNFPAVVWYRCHYWRQHLDQDFNLLCKIATRELLLMR